MNEELLQKLITKTSDVPVIAHRDPNDPRSLTISPYLKNLHENSQPSTELRDFFSKTLSSLGWDISSEQKSRLEHGHDMLRFSANTPDSENRKSTKYTSLTLKNLMQQCLKNKSIWKIELTLDGYLFGMSNISASKEVFNSNLDFMGALPIMLDAAITMASKLEERCKEIKEKTSHPYLRPTIGERVLANEEMNTAVSSRSQIINDAALFVKFMEEFVLKDIRAKLASNTPIHYMSYQSHIPQFDSSGINIFTPNTQTAATIDVSSIFKDFIAKFNELALVLAQKLAEEKEIEKLNGRMSI